MFNRVAGTPAVWQSPDGRMRAGSIHLDGLDADFILLGDRPVRPEDVDGAIGFLQGRTGSRTPLLLLSRCPGFAADATAEADGVIFRAGFYRRLQQEIRDRGVRLVSVIDTIAVGGTYLMHGLAAPDRLATPGTAFYDTVYPGRTVPLEAALSAGLITAVVPDTALMATIAGLLKRSGA